MARAEHAFAAAIAAIALLAAAGAGASEAVSGQDQRVAVASISVTRTDDGLLIGGEVVALAAGHYEATLSISKSGKAGSAKTSQASTLDLAAGQTGMVAQTGLSFAPGDTLDVSLDVTAGGVVVSNSRLRVP
jgi:hypothetical protein